MEDIALFTLTVLAILGAPGPTNTLLATAGATGGFRRSLPLIPAEAGGYLIAILTLGLMLGPLVAASAPLAMALRLAVGLYLMTLAWRLWRGGIDTGAGGEIITPRRIFLTTLLNPKAIIFALGVIPFGSPHVQFHLAGFLGLTALVALAWIGFGTLVGRMAGATGQTRFIPRLSAAVLSAFALLLLTAPLLR